MITELTRYYDKVGILSTNFQCPYYYECVQKNPGLITGKSAYIGTEYEKYSLPRILFVSLMARAEAGDDTARKRTPEGLRAIESVDEWQQYNPNLHWHATHVLAVLIAQVFNPILTHKDANSIFAHTNSAKCCSLNSEDPTSTGILYKNCKNLIAEELVILDPDIIISQGENAYKAVNFACEDISSEDRFRDIVKIHDRIHIISNNFRPVLHVKTIMPSWRNNRTQLQEKELYPFYLQAVRAYKEIILA